MVYLKDTILQQLKDKTRIQQPITNCLDHIFHICQECKLHGRHDKLSAWQLSCVAKFVWLIGKCHRNDKGSYFMQGNCFCLAGDINHLVRLALFFSFKERAFVLITPNDIINVTNLYRYMTKKQLQKRVLQTCRRLESVILCLLQTSAPSDNLSLTDCLYWILQTVYILYCRRLVIHEFYHYQTSVYVEKWPFSDCLYQSWFTS